MIKTRLSHRDFLPELIFRTSRSGGKGGQHVNKVETRVELWFYVDGSALLTHEEKQLIRLRLKSRINAEGCLRLSNSTERSQLKNKKALIEKFYETIEKALIRPKIRKETKPGKRAVEKRLKTKRERAEKKERRKFRDY